MEIKIVEIGVGFEICIILNGIKFYTLMNFETEAEAKQFLKEHNFI